MRSLLKLVNCFRKRFAIDARNRFENPDVCSTNISERESVRPLPVSRLWHEAFNQFTAVYREDREAGLIAST